MVIKSKRVRKRASGAQSAEAAAAATAAAAAGLRANDARMSVRMKKARLVGSHSARGTDRTVAVVLWRANARLCKWSAQKLAPQSNSTPCAVRRSCAPSCSFSSRYSVRGQASSSFEPVTLAALAPLGAPVLLAHARIGQLMRRLAQSSRRKFAATSGRSDLLASSSLDQSSVRSLQPASSGYSTGGCCYQCSCACRNSCRPKRACASTPLQTGQ